MVACDAKPHCRQEEAGKKRSRETLSFLGRRFKYFKYFLCFGGAGTWRSPRRKRGGGFGGEEAGRGAQGLRGCLRGRGGWGANFFSAPKLPPNFVFIRQRAKKSLSYLYFGFEPDLPESLDCRRRKTVGTAGRSYGGPSANISEVAPMWNANHQTQ